LVKRRNTSQRFIGPDVADGLDAPIDWKKNQKRPKKSQKWRNATSQKTKNPAVRGSEAAGPEQRRGRNERGD
jgi:hypothetical protein